MSSTRTITIMNRAKAALLGIREAIQNNGQIVSNVPAEDYPALIDAIGQGSGGGVIVSKNIVANGEYYAVDDEADGYSPVTVNVQPNLGTKSITVNGTYQASSDELDGFSEVTVNVPADTGTIISKSIDNNGTYNASSDSADGYNPVIVNVPQYPICGLGTISESIAYSPFECS